MAENRDTLESSGAVEDGDRPLGSSEPYSDSTDSPEDSNGFVHVESPAFTIENDVGSSSADQVNQVMEFCKCKVLSFGIG